MKRVAHATAFPGHQIDLLRSLDLSGTFKLLTTEKVTRYDDLLHARTPPKKIHA